MKTSIVFRVDIRSDAIVGDNASLFLT